MGSDGALAHRVEEACLKGWPALQEIKLDGWLLRFAEGHTRRANSVNPLRQGSRDLREKIAECEAAYRAQGLPTIFRISALTESGLDETLSTLGYGPPEDDTCVLYRALDAGEFNGRDADICENAPSEQWLDAHARCTGSGKAAQRAQRKILEALSVPAVFAGIRAAGNLASLAFGAVHDDLVCINLVVTDPALGGGGGGGGGGRGRSRMGARSGGRRGCLPPSRRHQSAGPRSLSTARLRRRALSLPLPAPRIASG
jgi:N-acetylglutamate synthase